MVIEKLTFSTSVSFTAAQRICYNLFQTYSENVCIDASLVMDQLEDVISHKKLTKRNSTNFQQDQDQNNFDTLSTTTTKDDCTSNDFMGSFSSLPAPDLGHVNDQGLRKAWSSIQSLENRLCPKSNDVPIALKLASVTSRIMYATHILLSMERVGTTKASNHFIFPLHNTQKKLSMPGTNLHTSILPVYDFVLDFLICCPRRGQSELETEDRKKGQGHSGSRSISKPVKYY